MMVVVKKQLYILIVIIIDGSGLLCKETAIVQRTKIPITKSLFIIIYNGLTVISRVLIAFRISPVDVLY